jgi:hypothetical protein
MGWQNMKNRLNVFVGLMMFISLGFALMGFFITPGGAAGQLLRETRGV